MKIIFDETVRDELIGRINSLSKKMKPNGDK